VLLAGFRADTGDLPLAAVLATMGFGMGLAMAPATEAIMGSLPPNRAGIGSAMNDVTREVAGRLGVAVLGSVLASAYTDGMAGAVDGLPPDAAAAAADSVGAAHEVAGGLGGESGAALASAANQAFVDAMSTTASIAAAVALAGAVVAARYLPTLLGPGGQPGQEPLEVRSGDGNHTTVVQQDPDGDTRAEALCVFGGAVHGAL
jgi:hypothetical protein